MSFRTSLVLKPQTSRVYLHGDCRQNTRIDGADFAAVASPDRMCGATWCAACRKAVPLDNVFWADTGESIKHYRKNVKRALEERTPFWIESLAFTLAFAGALLAGVPAAWIMRRDPDQFLVVVAVLLASMAGIFLGMVMGAFVRTAYHTKLLKNEFNASPRDILKVNG